MASMLSDELMEMVRATVHHQDEMLEMSEIPDVQVVATTIAKISEVHIQAILLRHKAIDHRLSRVRLTEDTVEAGSNQAMKDMAAARIMVQVTDQATVDMEGADRRRHRMPVRRLSSLRMEAMAHLGIQAISSQQLLLTVEPTEALRKEAMARHTMHLLHLLPPLLEGMAAMGEHHRKHLSRATCHLVSRSIRIEAQ